MPSCFSLSSEVAHAKKDCRVATVEQQQLQCPEFCYCVVEKGYFCKTCVSVSGIGSPGAPYITKAGIVVDHHSQRSTGHLEPKRHKEAIKNKESYNTLACKHTNVWKMLCEASLTLEINKANTNQFVLKSFFHITHLLVKQNRAHTQFYKCSRSFCRMWWKRAPETPAGSI